MFIKLRRVTHIAVTASMFLARCHPLHGQAGTQGTVSVTVTDPSGGVVPGASLSLIAIDTNSERKATEDKGSFNFVNLPIGVYRLAVSKNGYAQTLVPSVVVQSSQTTPITIILKIGSTTETVTVDASATPLIDATSNSIGAVINLKAIEDLPLLGRDLTDLARLTAGYTGGVNTNGTQVGVWNGQPFTNQGVNIDGVIGAASRGKYNGNVNASASPRIENIAEMSVETDQIDLDQGFGRSSMQISYVTRSGTNQFHGRVYADARNSGLFANTIPYKVAGLRRAKVIYNDFGGSLGGPIIKDKLFFFGSLSTRRVPQDISASNYYLTATTQQGNFTYIGTDNASHTVNLFNLASNYSSTLPHALNSVVAGQISAINASLNSGGTSVTTDPNINQISWNSAAPIIYYYPTVRLDYNTTNKLHMNLTWNMTQNHQSGTYQATFPGSTFSNQTSGYSTRGFTVGYGADYQVTPNIINQLKIGFLYAANKYGVGAQPLYASNPTVFWGLDNYGGGNMSGQVYTLPTSNFYPNFNASDSISWQKGLHSIKFGGMWNREQDHYWNPPAGFNNEYLGMASGDPAINAFSATALPNANSSSLAEAQQMYATLTGRISYVGGSYSYSQKSGSYYPGISAYNLDELQSAYGFFFQDSWRLVPTLTLNFGLRWDFTGDDHDLTNAYHSATEASLYGPSGINNLFNPGSLLSSNSPTIDTHPHAYAPWNVSPQPAVGFAWNPRDATGVWDKILGKSDSVIRGGFNLRNFTMPQQYFWNNASSYGAFFYQTFYLNANNTGTMGTFSPGTLALGNALPAFGYSPSSYVSSEAMSDFTFLNSLSFAGIDPKIKQPYTESWNLSLERKFGPRVVEVRYDGNRTLHQWLAINPNEVNVFENGFLSEFKKAQANYQASGGTTFHGANATPIFDAAFAGESSTNGALADYSNATYLNYMATGQVGAMASVLSGVAGTTSYFCNLVGVTFAPCAANAGYSGAGAGYATNFFQANPYAAGTSTSYMKAVGHSNYHALQVDFRQQSWKGFTYDANYTFGKTLAIGSTRNYTGGADNLMTLRDLKKGYGPTPYDIRHVLHVTSTYDLPFGKGKAFLNSNSIASHLFGDWNLGSIITFQSGAAQQIYGGNATYNDYADGGIRLTSVTRGELQKAVGVHRIAGSANATLIDPKYLKSVSGQGANTNYINPNTTPGTIGEVVFLYGPHAFYHDMSLSKSFPIHDRLKVKLQSEFLNVWNHPVYGSSPSSFGSSVQSTSFGVGTVTNHPRWIELRGNIEF